MLKTSLFAVVAVAVSACAAPPAPRERTVAETVDIGNANYGPYPMDYAALVKSWGTENLKDPESARYGKISKPRKEYMVANLQPFFGFSVCAVINAKNSYGGYTGSQTHWFLIRDGKIARAQNTERAIAGIVPGTTISRDHPVNCNDGDPEGN